MQTNLVPSMIIHFQRWSMCMEGRFVFRMRLMTTSKMRKMLYEPTLKSGIFEIQSDLYGYSG